MSGFAGVWHVDGRPADERLVRTMGSSVAHRGGDAHGVWCSGAIGFTAHLRRVAPESAHERQPAIDARGNLLESPRGRVRTDAICDDVVALDVPSAQSRYLSGAPGPLIRRRYPGRGIREIAS